VQGDKELEERYEEEDSWEEIAFLEGMEEADLKKKKGRSLFPDDLEEGEEEFEDTFPEDV
jgi:hypothetical protein